MGGGRVYIHGFMAFVLINNSDRLQGLFVVTMLLFLRMLRQRSQGRASKRLQLIKFLRKRFCCYFSKHPLPQGGKEHHHACDVHYQMYGHSKALERSPNHVFASLSDNALADYPIGRVAVTSHSGAYLSVAQSAPKPQQKRSVAVQVPQPSPNTNFVQDVHVFGFDASKAPPLPFLKKYKVLNKPTQMSLCSTFVLKFTVALFCAYKL